MDYQEAWELQVNLVAARNRGSLHNNIVLLLEHAPVFTLGRRGGEENFIVSREFLEGMGIPVLRVERGGNTTFHGPGQLVVYPIIDLRAERLGIADYVDALEEVMIRTAGDYGIVAGRNPLNRGVWVGNNKLGCIGIAIRHGISFHGFAFNVSTPLWPFRCMRPCGLSGIEMTTMERECGEKVSMESVRGSVKRHMPAVFNAALLSISLTRLEELMHVSASHRNTGVGA